MPPLYKEGFYWLILLAVTTAVYVALMLFIGPIRAQAAFFLFGLSGFLPLVYRKRGQAVVLDERDTQIAPLRPYCRLLCLLAGLYVGHHGPLGGAVPRRTFDDFNSRPP